MLSHGVAVVTTSKYAITMRRPSRISAEVCVSLGQGRLERGPASGVLRLDLARERGRGRVTFPIERAVAKVSVDPAQGKASGSWLPAPS